MNQIKGVKVMLNYVFKIVNLFSGDNIRFMSVAVISIAVCIALAAVTLSGNGLY